MSEPRSRTMAVGHLGAVGPSGAVRTRRAQPADAATVTRLLVEFRDHQGHASPSRSSFLASVQRLLERSDSEFWLASIDQRRMAAGVCQLRFRHSVWTAAEDCWLEDLFVGGAARRRGVGRALVRRAIERAGERGCLRIELDTNEDNHDALALYESLGFSAASKGASRSLFLGLPLSARGLT